MLIYYFYVVKQGVCVCVCVCELSFVYRPLVVKRILVCVKFVHARVHYSNSPDPPPGPAHLQYDVTEASQLQNRCHGH